MQDILADFGSRTLPSQFVSFFPFYPWLSLLWDAAVLSQPDLLVETLVQQIPTSNTLSYTVGPSILSIISSLATGSVPTCFKHAVVQPLLKKPNLDPTLPSNYRPISKLPFLSKVLEKVILCQLLPHLHQNNILERFQSGFRAHHSTESALLKVSNDLLLSVDSGDCAVLILLDLSAAFDTVDHNILIDRLQCGVGVSGICCEFR